MSIMFNEICINEEMLPKYTYFKYIYEYMKKVWLFFFIQRSFFSSIKYLLK